MCVFISREQRKTRKKRNRINIFYLSKSGSLKKKPGPLNKMNNMRVKLHSQRQAGCRQHNQKFGIQNFVHDAEGSVASQ